MFNYWEIPMKVRKVNPLITAINDQIKAYKNEAKEQSPIWDTVKNILDELTQKSRIDPKKVKILSGQDWKRALSFHVQLKKDLGASKKYIPV